MLFFSQYISRYKRILTSVPTYRAPSPTAHDVKICVFYTGNAIRHFATCIGGAASLGERDKLRIFEHTVQTAQSKADTVDATTLDFSFSPLVLGILEAAALYVIGPINQYTKTISMRFTSTPGMVKARLWQKPSFACGSLQLLQFLPAPVLR